MKTLAVLLIFALAGCATAGRKLDPAKVAQLKKGQTRAEVLALVGNPEQTATNSDGTSVMVWVYVHAAATPATYIPIAGAFVGGANAENEVLRVTFGADGTVTDFTDTHGTTQSRLGGQ